MYASSRVGGGVGCHMGGGKGVKSGQNQITIEVVEKNKENLKCLFGS